MKVALTAALACASLAVAASSWPAEQSRTDLIRIMAQTGGRFVFTQGQRKTVLNLQNSITGCTTQTYILGSNLRDDVHYGVRVLDEVSKDGFQYVVLQVSAPPNCNVNGVCGAGANNDVLWLKFDSRLGLLSKQAENVEDCQRNKSLISAPPRPDSFSPLNMQGGVLSLRLEETDFAANSTRRTALRYDRRVPERGLVVSK